MPTKTRRILITLPEKMLKDVDWLAPLEDMTRDQLIYEAVERFLKPHLEIRKQVLKAAAKPGKMHGPFNTVEEFLASLHKEAKKLATRKQMRAEARKSAKPSAPANRQLEALEAAAGTWKDKDHPELKQGSAKWVQKLRRESEQRFKTITSRSRS